MNFQVPQFIEVESKIFGPLSFSQFIFLAGSGAIAFLFYVFMPSIYIAIIPIILSLSAGGALAFYKVNNRSLIYLTQSIIKYLLSNRLYIWQKKNIVPNAPRPTSPTQTSSQTTKISNSRLEELSWSLDINKKVD